MARCPALRRAGLAELPVRKAGKRVPPSRTITDLVERKLHRDGPNQVWVTDPPCHPTRKGKLQCCVVIETGPRRIAGWAIDSSPRTELATNVLGLAIDSRSDSSGQVLSCVIHCDHGTQFKSWGFTDRARRAGLLASLGSVGDAKTPPSRRPSGGRLPAELLNWRWSST